MQGAVLAHPSELFLINADLSAAGRYGTKMSSQKRSIPLVESQHHVVNPANPRGARDDGVEHWLHVRRRAADNAKHLGRCGLMLQGFSQFRIALLVLFEQPHILNRDHGLADGSLYYLDLIPRAGT